MNLIVAILVEAEVRIGFTLTCTAVNSIAFGVSSGFPITITNIDTLVIGYIVVIIASLGATVTVSNVGIGITLSFAACLNKVVTKVVPCGIKLKVTCPGVNKSTRRIDLTLKELAKNICLSYLSVGITNIKSTLYIFLICIVTRVIKETGLKA